MAVLEWDKSGERYYETGVDKVVLYPKGSTGYKKGIAWNGVTGVTSSPDGAEAKDVWADNIKYLVLRSKETLKVTIKAYTYPDEFKICDGSAEVLAGISFGQQTRMPFAISYVTKVGNDVEFEDYGYKIHLVYNLTASPSEQEHATMNDDSDQLEFSWECTSTPEIVKDVEGKKFKATSEVTIDSKKVTTTSLKKIEDALYGTATEEAKILLPNEVATLAKASGTPIGH